MENAMRLNALMATLVAVVSAMGIGATTATAAPVSGQGTWETTLLLRDINGHPTTNNAAAEFA